MWEQVAIQVASAVLSNPTVQKGIVEAITELRAKNDIVLNAFLDSAEKFLQSIRGKQ